MPYPRWLAKFNRRVINPRQLRKGTYPVVTHVGRTSGRSYQNPLDAYPTETGYVLVARQDFHPLTAPAVICRWCRDLVRTGRMPVNDGNCGDCARRLQSRLGCGTDGLNVTKCADGIVKLTESARGSACDGRPRPDLSRHTSPHPRRGTSAF